MFDLNPVVPVPAAHVAAELASAERSIARWEAMLVSVRMSDRSRDLLRASLRDVRAFRAVLLALPTQEG